MRWQNVAALRWADLAVSIAPRNALARAARATLLEKLERFSGALGRFDEAIACFNLAIAAPSAIRE